MLDVSDSSSLTFAGLRSCICFLLPCAVDVEDLRRLSKSLSTMATEKQKAKVGCMSHMFGEDTVEMVSGF